MMKRKTAARPRPSQSLTQRAAQLQATHRFLEQSVLRQKQAEAALRASGRRGAKVLQKSWQLQDHLRALIYRLLTAQESERTKISHELQDEVAQTLLGIQAHLLTLKKTADGDTENLRKEIATTRRVVKESMDSINRFARELGLPALVPRAPARPG